MFGIRTAGLVDSVGVSERTRDRRRTGLKVRTSAVRGIRAAPHQARDTIRGRQSAQAAADEGLRICFLITRQFREGLKTSIRDRAPDLVPIHAQRRAKLESSIQMMLVRRIDRKHRGVNDAVQESFRVRGDLGVGGSGQFIDAAELTVDLPGGALKPIYLLIVAQRLDTFADLADRVVLVVPPGLLS